MPKERARLRDLGLKIGRFPVGRNNAITDVPGVQVGHSTIIKGSGKLNPGKGPIRTGVTAILPNARNVFEKRVTGSGFVLNGAGEIMGFTQVMEWGLIETPILLTNTLSIGTCAEATIKFMVNKYPTIGDKEDVIIPIVGECDDSWLNDIVGRHVRHEHVFEAIKNAQGGPVAEGNVGGGTGMVTCDFKGGIGTSSRRLPKDLGGFVIGVLVMSNFGYMNDLRVDGIPIGNLLAPRYSGYERRENNYGSIIAVVATNAPLSSHQVGRLCKRAALGIGRVGSYASYVSGEIIIGFSNANIVPRKTKTMVYSMELLLDEGTDPLHEAVVDATEEAILNAICMAEPMEGHSKHVAPALPLGWVKNILKDYHRI